MAVQMSEKQFRQQFSPEQRKALERLLQRQAEENNKSAAESEASTDTPKSTLSGAAGPPAIPPKTPPANQPNGGSGDNRVIAVRVVENHPSVQPQTVKVVADSTAAGVVASIKQLDEDTKFGFMRLVMAFSQLYDSLKNIGTAVRGPSSAPPQSTPARRYQRTSDPARPESGPIKPYTRQADKFETYGNKVFHERVQEALTPEALGDRLKNYMFDREGFIGGYAHRMFDRRKIGRTQADRKLRESEAHLKSIDADARELAESGKSEAEVEAYRKTRIESGVQQGIITTKTRKQLTKEAIEVNDLRQQAAKKLGVLELRKGRGELKESVNLSDEAVELEAINEKIAGIDDREGYLFRKYRANEEEKRKNKRGTTSATPEPAPAPVEPEIGSPEKPYVWPSSRTEPEAAPTGDSIEAKRSNDSAQSTKESQEEAAQFNAEFLKGVERIEENTRPIPEISKFLNEKFGAKEGGSETEGGAEPSSILPSITDLIPAIPGVPTAMSLAKKAFSPVGAKMLGGAYQAYSAYSDYSDANTELAEGKITAEEATAKKGGAIGEGVLGVGGSIAGYGVGAGAGALVAGGLTAITGGLAAPLAPLITRAGGALGSYYGGEIAGGIGSVIGETATAGAQSLYHGYQWLTGQEDEDSEPVKKKKRKRANIDEPDSFKHRSKFVSSYTKRHAAFPDDVDSVNDARSEADLLWKANKPYDEWYPNAPAGARDSLKNQLDSSFQRVDRMDAESFKRPPAPTPSQTNNTGIVVNAPSSNTTQVMPPPTKPSFNTDPTFLKYGSSRWS